ncbi:FAD-dependent oxidoreductase [Burkholderia sp. Ac-20353]|uniref:flavin monoamine oxidase family protein n=1 Tax=Burkholderia sp. Ac-20353 TaxID=2703894 RepID=UPI00197BFC4B|nr:FAD-dependent oxidoreductase [Burkholderia sp. Ac-20353]MBN3785376.1 NAD(P)-binding protein [Burkholderia sp. Ac-20353]
MPTTRIAIVGGGLSGLYAACLLEEHGIHDYQLFEARDALGGRILSVAAPGDVCDDITSRCVNRFDLGPTWFWPEVQPQLDRLVHALGLDRFEQHTAGDMLIERSRNEQPARMPTYANSPASMRLVGGMSALIDALGGRLDATRIRTGTIVRRLRCIGEHIEVDSEDAAGNVATVQVEHVLLAVPPRLVEECIKFAPALPPSIAQQWRRTGTWMAPHAKYVALYGTPFWREQGLSGDARSACGPLSEIHDASMAGGSAALFGFFGVPARLRASVADDVLLTHCRAQLARLFGPAAATPVADFIKDWASDPYTATYDDAVGALPQHEIAAPQVPQGPWSVRLTGIASEWSRPFPGYVAGAIDAAARGVQALISARQRVLM